jgi:hypothetical protein
VLCALVKDGVVTEIKTLDDAGYQAAAKVCQAVIDITDTVPQPEVGWTFTGNTLVSNGVTQMIITKLALLNRFTNSEMMAILAYVDTPTNPYCYAVRMILQKQQVSTYIDLTRTDTQLGVQTLVAAGLLTSQRAQAILTTPPTSIEVYKGQI